MNSKLSIAIVIGVFTGTMGASAYDTDAPLWHPANPYFHQVRQGTPAYRPTLHYYQKNQVVNYCYRPLYGRDLLYARATAPASLTSGPVLAIVPAEQTQPRVATTVIEAPRELRTTARVTVITQDALPSIAEQVTELR